MPRDHRLYKYRRGGNKNLSGILFYKATPGVTSALGFNFEGECMPDVGQVFLPRLAVCTHLSEIEIRNVSGCGWRKNCFQSDVE